MSNLKDMIWPYLFGKLSGKECVEFESALEIDASLRNEYNKVSKINEELNAVQDKAEISIAINEIQRRKIKKRQYFYVALAVLGLIALFYYYRSLNKAAEGYRNEDLPVYAHSDLLNSEVASYDAGSDSAEAEILLNNDADYYRFDLPEAFPLNRKESRLESELTYLKQKFKELEERYLIAKEDSLGREYADNRVKEELGRLEVLKREILKERTEYHIAELTELRLQSNFIESSRYLSNDFELTDNIQKLKQRVDSLLIQRTDLNNLLYTQSREILNYQRLIEVFKNNYALNLEVKCIAALNRNRKVLRKGPIDHLKRIKVQLEYLYNDVDKVYVGLYHADSESLIQKRESKRNLSPSLELIMRKLDPVTDSITNTAFEEYLIDAKEYLYEIKGRQLEMNYWQESELTKEGAYELRFYFNTEDNKFVELEKSTFRLTDEKGRFSSIYKKQECL